MFDWVLNAPVLRAKVTAIYVFCKKKFENAILYAKIKNFKKVGNCDIQNMILKMLRRKFFCLSLNGLPAGIYLLKVNNRSTRTSF